MVGGATGSVRWLVGIFAVSFAVRLAFGLVVAPDLPPPSDRDWYREMAGHLADGNGLSLRPSVTPGAPEAELAPTAKHPPLHPTVLAAGGLVNLDSFASQRVLLAGLSALGVTAFAWGVARLIDRRVGLLAGLVAALDPLQFQPSGLIVSEATYLAVLGALTAATAVAVERRTPRAMAVVGAVVGLAALTRSEAVLLVGFVVLPLAARYGRPMLKSVGVATAATVLVVAPWIVRNVVVMDSAQISLNGGVTLAGANCSEAYEGERLGGFVLNCAAGVVGVLVAVSENPSSEADIDREARRHATDFARSHQRTLPKVAAARVGRTLGFVHRADQLNFDVAEGRSRPWQRGGLTVRMVLLPVAGLGAAVAYRRRLGGALLVGAGLLGSALVTSALIYGSTRMGVNAQPAIVMFASLAAVAVFDRLRGASNASSVRPPPSAELGTTAG